MDNVLIDKKFILRSLEKSQAIVSDILTDQTVLRNIMAAIELVYHCLQNGGKLLFVGNGGSAADAQHISAEYVSRFMFDRPGLPSIALTTDTSAITAISNDYGFEKLFSRQVQALGQKGDILFAYSTSGTSPNIIEAIAEAKHKGIKSIGMTGAKPQSKKMTDLCDITIHIPSSETSHIQEGHLIVGHLICYIVEQIIFKNEGR